MVKRDALGKKLACIRFCTEWLGPETPLISSNAFMRGVCLDSRVLLGSRGSGDE